MANFFVVNVSINNFGAPFSSLILRSALLASALHTTISFRSSQAGFQHRRQCYSFGSRNLDQRHPKHRYRQDQPVCEYCLTDDGQQRHVRPYSQTLRAFAKERWLGKKLIDVFESEFVAFPPEYYAAAIENGRIRVNGAIVAMDYVLREGDGEFTL